LVETAVAVNDQRKRTIVRKVVSACGGSVRGKTIAMLGLTFKPNTDDMREAPSLSIIQALIDLGAQVRAFDPEGMTQARTLLDSSVSYAEGPYDCAKGAEALVIVTEWNQFRALDFGRLRRAMSSPVVVDLRNIYKREEILKHGFQYVNVGEGAAADLVAFAEAAE
jgi:UDPglucose 6-dehydrogenase